MPNPYSGFIPNQVYLACDAPSIVHTYLLLKEGGKLVSSTSNQYSFAVSTSVKNKYMPMSRTVLLCVFKPHWYTAAQKLIASEEDSSPAPPTRAEVPPACE